jgi:golgi apparatus protein 1
MGGRIIQCLRSKYTDTAITLGAQCVSELIDVIQTSKLDVKFDVQLYQNCRQVLTNQCTGIEQEDCLKLLYQKNQIPTDACKQQIQRIIREGRADIHVDRALSFACQADILKYCNDIPIGKRRSVLIFVDFCLFVCSIFKAVANNCNVLLAWANQ